jgi:hypothetical protein
MVSPKESIPPVAAAEIGMTTWSAPNPFGEPTAFVLVHPIAAPDDGTLAEAIAHLGLKRLDASGDILPIGTDTLYAALRALRVELCDGDGVWLSRPVTDDWTGCAIGRRYIVLAIGGAPLSDEADARAISAYLADRTAVHAALVKIRVRFDRT